MRGYYVKGSDKDKAIGSNRGKPRIWLQGGELAGAGLAPGDRYEIHLKGGTVILRANPDGSRTVSHKEVRSGARVPVIDLNSKELLALFDGMSSIRLVQRKGEVYLLPLASELRKKERLQRLKDKVESGEPLAVGSLSHGGGLLSHAVHEGLQEAGIESYTRFANEIRPELLEHAARVSEHWREDTIALAAPMQELAFDEAGMRHIPRVDVMEMGLPCSGASKAGRAKRGTDHPEQHPEVGHLVVAALVILAKANPAVVLFENVIPYASSASASILRNQLRDLGYNTHETVLRGEDFNALEHRDRWCMVATTEGMHFDWSMLQLPAKVPLKLSDVLDDIPADDPAWSEMKGLKAKQERDIANGKGFMMQTFGADSEKIATLTKGYAKVRSTDPKIEHPTNPDLLRQVTPAEHARIKQFPERLIAGMSATIAHEVLGQGVQRDPFKAAGKLSGEAIARFVFGLDHKPADELELANVISSELTDTASRVVAEIRAPLKGVIYEGPVTVNDLGMTIQDIGNGVGILHKTDALEQVRLGEVLRVQYPSMKANPVVEHLSRPSPEVSNSLAHAITEHQQEAPAQQSDLFAQPAARKPYSPGM
ncbi:DNA cytosine methyltransferase [Pseudomonas sp. o96-267]|uniref:DNA cytosine methyltransferase n=1 Tax=Pseudomonas sp. o96-267 TaxID=2479853 RepID=UPI000F790FA6|nr:MULTISPECIES: DNA cytosine methyltransferase [Pseudomonas]MDH0959112.1 DNA cytosine methyltransferase [Pseudomonas chengduensis]MDV5863580.1 DNA cytosine methyltransferase [Pseudomonas mendocina]RRV31693.1 DNA cytosine methyltransferase [Pseudomonas sp. o96-267]